MAIENVPVISADWPLFDWAGHEDSLAALVKDGPVAGFRKETWNAIVDALAAALEAAGVAWDTDCHVASLLAMTEETDCHVASLLAMTEGEGYEAEDCKVLQAYGALSAGMFNAVAGNISQAAPIGKWVWARDPEFRGYIGREAFRGYENCGLECDLVYPEYFHELVRRLNLLIEIMRGTAPFGDFAAAMESECGVDATVYSRKSVPMDVDHMSVSPVEAPLLARKSAPLDVDHISRSVTEARPVALPPAWLDVDQLSEASEEATLKDIPVARLGYRRLLRSAKEGQLAALKLQAMTGGAFGRSRASGKMGLLKMQGMSGGGIGVSSGRGTAVTVKTAPLGGRTLSKGRSQGQVLALPPMPVSGSGVGCSESRGGLAQLPSLAVSGSGNARTVVLGKAEKLRSAKLRAGLASAGGAVAVLESLWYPPELTGGVLFIRSSYEDEQAGDVLLLDTTDTPWTEPVLTDGVLTVYQSRMSGGEINLEVR